MRQMAKLKYILGLFLLLALVACSRNEGEMANRVSGGNNVDKVMDALITKAESENDPPVEAQVSDATSKEGAEEGIYIPKTKDSKDSAKVDYDLTKMSSDMVYATVYQMMVDPEPYVGKTFRMEGRYYPAYIEATGKVYHYCLVEDALACCAQGIEFVWGDGSHVYPDDYPKENGKIVIQGVFETYKEEGDDYLYCRLKEATMEAIDK